MARTIKTETDVFTYAELSDEAKAKAVADVGGKLTGEWWDMGDTERLGETILYGLAEALKSPGWDTYGEGDFPGIDGVEIQGWDLDRGQSIEVKGYLTRENAPALPWVDGVESVALRDPDYWRHVEVCFDDSDETPSDDAVNALRDAASDAIRFAWQAGYSELEYMSSDEYVIEDIEANEREFTIDGELY